MAGNSKVLRVVMLRVAFGGPDYSFPFPERRTVTVELTEEQQRSLAIVDRFEGVELCFLEDAAS